MAHNIGVWGMAKIFEFPGVKVDRKTRGSLESGILRMIRRVRPDWPKHDMILQRLSQGDRLTATESVLYGGYTDDKNEMVLVKVYGDSITAESKSTEIGLMRLFAHQRFGSRIYATFSNGVAYEYANGITLDFKVAVDKNVYPLIAKKVGLMHRVMSKHTGLPANANSVPHVFNTLRSWLSRVPMRLADPRNHHRMLRELPLKATIATELEELELRILHYPPSPFGDQQQPFVEPQLVFCHNDLCPENIIYDAVARTVTFIHLECAGSNFQAFEIARHFYTLCGSDMTKVGSSDFVPAAEFQMRWCHNYLAAFKDISMQKVSLIEIERMYSLVQRFSLVFLLQEIIWSLINVENENTSCHTTSSDFDILGYGIRRYQQYRRNKYNILSLNI